MSKNSRRIDDLVNKFGGNVDFDGGKNIKNTATQLSRTVANLTGLIRVLDSDDLPSCELWKSDLKKIRSTVDALTKLQSDLEVAKSRANQMLKIKIKERAELGDEMLERRKKDILDCLGENDSIRTLASDLIKFSGINTDFISPSRGIMLWNMQDMNQVSNAIACEPQISDAELVEILAKLSLSTPWPLRGSKYCSNSENRVYWFSGWEDFIAWRSIN